MGKWKVFKVGNGYDIRKTEVRTLGTFQTRESAQECADNFNRGDMCLICKYYTFSHVCHPYCGGCDGKNHFVERGLIK